MKTLYTIILCLLSILSVSANSVAENRIIKGTVTDKISGETLIGVNIYLPELKKGATTNENGEYLISNIPNIRTTIQVSYIGHQTIIQSIDLGNTTTLDFVLDEANASINEVVVTALTGNSLIERTPAPISFIPRTELLRTSSSNIIDAIAKQPGVSQITTGSGISKPVIRGLGYNRVVVINDGVRQEGQQWGDEHGIEIDGQSIHSIEILKGPASLMYGSDALAGVVKLMAAPTLPEGKIEASALTEYQTNNGLINYSVNTAGNKKGFVWDWRFSQKLAHAYKNKYDGYVLNSGFREYAINGLLGINRSWGYSHLTLGYYQMTPGIIEGERDEETGKFIKPIIENGKAGEAIASSRDFKSYHPGVPYQQIYHYKATLNNNIIVGGGNIKSTIGYQQNRRQEFEEVVNPKDYSLYFQMHTINYDVRYILPEINDYKIVTGINGMYQHSLNKGTEYLIPEYNLFDAGVFVIASRNFGKLDISGGIRFDHRNLHSRSLYLTEDQMHHHHDDEDDDHEHDHDHGDHDHDHDGDHHDDELIEYFPDFKRNYSALTGSIGLTYQLGSGWATKLNLSHGFRAPNISELASQGSHGGAIRYEIGNTNLKAERSWQIDLGASYSSQIISGEIALFANRINNYIFSHKLLDEHGHDLITDGNRTYQFTSGDARILGGEISIDFHPIERLHFQNSFSIVSSEQMHQSDSTKYLPFTPAPKWTSDVRFDLIRHGKTLNNTYISFGLEHNWKQDKYYSAFGTETETPAYTLLNAGLGTDFMYKGKTIASIYITANNLTDKAYQNHLSRLKYSDFNNVTGRQGVYNMGRSFGFKVLIPLTF